MVKKKSPNSKPTLLVAFTTDFGVTYLKLPCGHTINRAHVGKMLGSDDPGPRAKSNFCFHGCHVK
jgi:hypothetical protein